MSGSTVLKIIGGITAAVGSMIGIAVCGNLINRNFNKDINPIKVAKTNRKISKMMDEIEEYAESNPDWNKKWFDD